MGRVLLVIAVTVGRPDRKVYPGLIEQRPSAWITWFVEGARATRWLAHAQGATAIMWLMSDTEALAFIAIVALMLAVAVVLVIA
jgi:hypothetical protein